jgi:hypothetical protein
MSAEYAPSIPTNKGNKIIKISIARIEYRKYKSLHQEMIIIQSVNKEK